MDRLSEEPIKKTTRAQLTNARALDGVCCARARAGGYAHLVARKCADWTQRDTAATRQRVTAAATETAAGGRSRASCTVSRASYQQN